MGFRELRMVMFNHKVRLTEAEQLTLHSSHPKPRATMLVARIGMVDRSECLLEKS